MAKHDKESIERRPGWIWRWTGVGRKPPYYDTVEKGDKFILYAYKTSEEGDSFPCSEIFGFYTVTSPVSERRQFADEYWVISGKPVLAEGWVTCPSPTGFFAENKFHQASIIPLRKDEYSKFLNYYQTFLKADWGILSREPKYEAEVIALFSRYMDRLGYSRFEMLGNAVPDAILVKKDGKRVKVEFEIFSSGLQTHTLNELKGATCICWTDDLPPNSPYRRIPIIPIKEKLFRILNPAAL